MNKEDEEREKETRRRKGDIPFLLDCGVFGSDFLVIFLY